MSEELKRKILNYEEIPPEKVWDKIAASLNEEVNAEFPQKLYHAEINPPAETWDKIAAALDSNIVEQYPSKLYNLEVAPPTGTWQKISAALDEEKALHVIPVKRKVIPFARYAVAASIIGILAFGAIKLLNQKSDEPAAATTKIIPDPNNSAVAIQPKNQKDSVNRPATALTNNLPKERVVLARLEDGPKRRTETGPLSYMTDLVNVSHPDETTRSGFNFQQMSLRGNAPATSSLVSDAADRYLMFMNPDGYLIRMSKKLAEALGCLYTNESSEDYRQCQEKVKKWRDKIAQSPVTPSPDNFMDILDLMKSIENNEL